ncbi:MAG: nucleotide exchange factor GrpE [Bacillota bacterium]
MTEEKLQPETGGEEREPAVAATAPEGEAAEALEDDPVSLELQELQLELEELNRRYIRLQADFDNYRKRTLREREEQSVLAELALLENLLPVLDNFERALANCPSDDPWVEGVLLVQRQLLDILKRCGLEPIECLHQPFDPNLHEAVQREESSEVPDGTVLRELKTGYLYKGRLLRASVVIVSYQVD